MIDVLEEPVEDLLFIITKENRINCQRMKQMKCVKYEEMREGEQVPVDPF
jgi:hypothetical protein